MKKHYSLIFLLIVFSFFTSKAQILTEDFSNAVPPTGWTIDAHSGNWEQRTSSTAEGTAPEARFHWSPQFNGDSRLISPTIDLTGINDIIIDFKHSVNNYGAGYSVGVATRSGGGAWNTVWTMPGANITEGKTILVSNADTNQSDFQMCFFFSGNSFQINDWYLDDLVISEAQNTDLALFSNNTEEFIAQGNVDVSCTVKNFGINPITSFDINYQVAGNSMVSENVTGVNILSTQSYNHTFATQWSATSGNYTITTTATNINGSGDDDFVANNTNSKQISVATQSVSNTPFFESFTSSTCGPCYGFNTNTFNPFMSSHNDIAVLKYQMSWPGAGDPYYTDEGGVRRGYYGVNGIPDLFTGGQDTATSSSAVNSAYNTQSAKPAFFDLSSTFTVTGDVVDVNIDITPYVTGTFTLHTAIIEKLTTGNVASNGETSFENVMMKMMPNASGVQASFTADTAFNTTYSHDMSSTFVEEMSDLAVVVFIQNDQNGSIMQSYYAENATAGVNDIIFDKVSISPNPTKGILNISSDQELQFSITDILGRVVLENKTVYNNDKIDISNLNNGVYLVKVSNGISKGTQKIILNK